MTQDYKPIGEKVIAVLSGRKKSYSVYATHNAVVSVVYQVEATSEEEALHMVSEGQYEDMEFEQIETISESEADFKRGNVDIEDNGWVEE